MQRLTIHDGFTPSTPGQLDMPKPRKKTASNLPGRLARRLPATTTQQLLRDVRSLIEEARDQTARAVNSTLVVLYWHIGKRIREDILQERRAEYGEKIVRTLSEKLTAEYGRGFSRQNLFRMPRFAEVFPDEQIVSSLMRQLSWTHFVYIVPIEDPLPRTDECLTPQRAPGQAGVVAAHGFSPA